MSSNLYPSMLNARQVLRAVLLIGLLGLFPAAQVAFAQTFGLTASSFYPTSIIPGGTATATLDLTASGGFTGSVALSCTVAPAVTTGVAPSCLVSPSSATPAATPSLTVSTTAGADGTPAGSYTFTVTGTSGTQVVTTALYLTLVDVQPNYTLTISTPVSPSTVTAGNGATASIQVTPVAGYSGSVTLSCLSVTPVVNAAPICSFSPQPVMIVNGSGPPSTLTISTYGTIITPVAKGWARHIFFALWLGFPGLAIVSMSATSKRRGKVRRTLMGIFFLMALGGSILLLPSCSSTTHAVANSTLITPKNTYTITLNGVDSTGVSPSNTTTAQATVTLIVN
ncbi:MAG: hypothetical protein WCC95_08030 [Candidatus Sulfotelmatobacter sp.]